MSDRSPGWDSKVRSRVMRECGGIAALAQEWGVPTDRHPMKVWSDLVLAFGGTDRIESYLDSSMVEARCCV